MAENGFPIPQERIARQKLPHWDELPDLELYMDQVLSLLQRCLGNHPSFIRKGLTASMVNNYVKLGVMPPPARKKYTRTHVAYLIIICVLKPCMPIDFIKNMIAASLQTQSVQTVYENFCTLYADAVQEAAGGIDVRPEKGDWRTLAELYRASLRAQAEQALAIELYEAALEKE